MTPVRDATALAEELAAGTLSSVALTQTSLERIAAQDGAINAFCALNADALDAAKASDARRTAGQPKSVIDGLPVAIKDSLEVAGMPCTWGSAVFAHHVPPHDELPVARLREAGAILIGKTNAPEFTLEGYTGNALHGTTRNPWDLALTPGGSSGGSVAAVAAGLVPVAIGTDGGGSIRRPAGFTGLVGLKPSIGRVARVGGLPQLLLDFEVVGPVCRTVRDAALLMGVLAGPDPRDHQSMNLPTPDVPDRPLRILATTGWGDAPVDPMIRSATEAAAKVLSDLGHQVSFAPLPLNTATLDGFWPNFGKWGLAGLRASHSDFDRLASQPYISMADEGDGLGADALLEVLRAIKALRDEAAVLFRHVDLVLTPTSAAMPWPAEERYPDHIAGEAVGPRGHAVFTGWVNACGHPAIALPSEPCANGCPIGVQLVAGIGAEGLLLEVAASHAAAAAHLYGRAPSLLT